MRDAVLNFFILNKECIIEKISYERRAYESVYEKSLSQVMSRKTMKKEFMHLRFKDHFGSTFPVQIENSIFFKEHRFQFNFCR